jgi:hypothetical protein
VNAHDDLLKTWWWFDPANANERCEAALAWETIRRTIAYPALWRKWSKERSAFDGVKTKPSFAEFFKKAYLFGQAKDAIGEEYFKLLWNGFDPCLHWLELSQAQRLDARGFIAAGNKAWKFGTELTLPRQTPPDPYSVLVGVCEIHRDGSGRSSVKEIHGHASSLNGVEDADFFKSLAPGRYLCATFDTRLGRDELLKVLEGWMHLWLCWLASPKQKPPLDYHVPSHEVHIIPTSQPAYAICLLPATYHPLAFRAAFHTQFKPVKSTQWHRLCVDYWKTLTFPSLEIRMHPNGTPDVEGGCLVYETITRYFFRPEEHLPPASKPTKSSRRKNPWIGLAANDAVKAGQPLGKNDPLSGFLLRHCKNCQELRNSQRSVMKRLQELDKHLGRLDKLLSYWIQKNTALNSLSFFSAAAGE